MRILRFSGLVSLLSRVALLSCASPEPVAVDGPDATPVDAGVDTAVVDSSPKDVADSRTPSCSDGVRNGSETDIDCGGDCSGCGDGLGCTKANDCKAGSCVAAKCGPHAWTIESNGNNVSIPPDNTPSVMTEPLAETIHYTFRSDRPASRACCSIIPSRCITYSARQDMPG